MKRSEGVISSFLALLLFSVLSIPACNNSNPVNSEESPPGVLVPLKVGNYWTYELSYYINGQPNGLTDTFTVRIVADTNLTYEGITHKATVREILHNKSNTVSEAKWFESNGDDGLYNLGGFSEEDTLLTKFLELKYPVNVGESWEVPRLVYHLGLRKFMFTDTLTYTCVAKDSLFETFNKSFNCYVFHYKKEIPEDDVSGLEDFYLFYAPGIGLVGLERKFENYLLDKLTLYEYNVR
jgi:hypothetical protein